MNVYRVKHQLSFRLKEDCYQIIYLDKGSLCTVFRHIFPNHISNRYGHNHGEIKLLYKDHFGTAVYSHDSIFAEKSFQHFFEKVS